VKTISIVLCGTGAAAAYVALSFALSGEGGFSLAVIVGMVVALALTGVPRSAVASAAETAGDLGEKGEVKVEGQGQVGEEVKVEGQEGRGEEKVSGESRRTEKPQSSANADASGNDCGAAGGRPQCASRTFPAVPCQPQPPSSTFSQPPTSVSSVAELWEKARVMVHNVIPDFDEDAQYLNLVYSAAEQGHVRALAKLGDYAFRRGAFVEAYFWTKIAKRRLELAGDADAQGLKEIGTMLQNIRREWTAAGQPPEYENVYDNFPTERGEIGRAFLSIDSGIQANQARGFIRELAMKGNPDAALFVLSADE